MFAYRETEVSKLVELKSWLELNEAAKALSALVAEEIDKGDLFRLALDGHLKMSVRFLSAARAKCGRAVPSDKAKWRTIPLLDGEGFIRCVDGTVLPDESVIEYEPGVKRLLDVWDLAMLGGDRLEIENRYEESQCREAPELFNLEGAFVTDGKGLYCQLLDRFENSKVSMECPIDDPSHYYPAAGLPEDSVLVVRTSALRALATKVGEKIPRPVEEKPLGRRERATLLTIIAALAQIAKVDVGKASSAAAAIESETERMGARVASRTIENHLKAIPEALESRAD